MAIGEALGQTAAGLFSTIGGLLGPNPGHGTRETREQLRLRKYLAGDMAALLGATPPAYGGQRVAPLSTWELMGLSSLGQQLLGGGYISPFAGGEMPGGAYAPPSYQPPPGVAGSVQRRNIVGPGGGGPGMGMGGGSGWASADPQGGGGAGGQGGRWGAAAGSPWIGSGAVPSGFAGAAPSGLGGTTPPMFDPYWNTRNLPRGFIPPMLAGMFSGTGVPSLPPDFVAPGQAGRYIPQPQEGRERTGNR